MNGDDGLEKIHPLETAQDCESAKQFSSSPPPPLHGCPLLQAPDWLLQQHPASALSVFFR